MELCTRVRKRRRLSFCEAMDSFKECYDKSETTLCLSRNYIQDDDSDGVCDNDSDCIGDW